MRMSSLSSYELTHPELLSEHQLRKLLDNSCIDTFNLKKLCKSELLEMYKRISMPLPQRQRGNARISNAEVNMTLEESVTVARDNICSSNINEGSKRMFQSLQLEEDKLRFMLNDQTSTSKKIQLSSVPKVETACNGINKRKLDGQNQESLVKKRQKITWP